MSEDINNNNGDVVDESEYVDILSLIDGDGVTHEFEKLDEMDLNDSHYVALIPDMGSDEDALSERFQLVIMRETFENGEPFYELLEDDAEFIQVGDIFRERLSEMFDFDDD